jgi:glutamate/tyrosine decarboxylase-like PLP-dependent enzyme
MKDFGCALCGIPSMNSQAILNAHLAGKKHAKKAAKATKNQQLPKLCPSTTQNCNTYELILMQMNHKQYTF